jgi:hypothetical protein
MMGNFEAVRKLLTLGLGVWMMVVLAVGVGLQLWSAADAQQTRGNSRLSQLIRNKPNLYLPSRMLIGEENKFTFQGPAGSQVILYVSAEPSGMEAPDGRPLRVGAENQQFTGTIPEKGVLEMTVPLPHEEFLIGKSMFVEGILWTQDDYADLAVFDIVDSTGRRSGANALVISQMSNGKGAFIMPSMPGMPSGLVNQITTLSEMKGGDQRKKELIDLDGDLNRDVMLNQNMFLNRPGGLQQP